jgi:phosphoserine phosphatase
VRGQLVGDYDIAVGIYQIETVGVVKFTSERPRMVITTDVNGTTTPENTFAELVRPDGLFDAMEILMKRYTSGSCKFSEVLPKMKSLAADVDRPRLESYAQAMPLYSGVNETFKKLIQSENLDAKLALSTTGFAGLVALVNKFRHGGMFHVAASPVLVHSLSQEEKSCLIRAITDEEEKMQVIDDLVHLHKPSKQLLFHIGDTMGDFLAIKHAAELGGIGVGFKPNEPLRASIASLPKDLRKRICEIDFAADEEPDYARVGDVIKETAWQRLKKQL